MAEQPKVVTRIWAERELLFGQRNFLFSQEPEIGKLEIGSKGSKSLNSLRDRLPKPRREAEIVENFQEFLCYFFFSEEIAATSSLFRASQQRCA